MRSSARFYSRLLAGLVSVVVSALTSSAAVTITTATGGDAISADTAVTALSPAWTSLGPIVLSEPGNSKGDLGGGTLVLKAPAGFEFNTAVTPSISFADAQDVAAAAIEVTDSATLTLTLTVTNTSTRDTVTIGGTTALQVRPTSGSPLPVGVLYRPSSGGGTAVIAGITTTANADGSGGTSFGTLRAVSGAARQLALQTAPPASATAGIAFSPAPVLVVKDQFGNPRNAANGAADNSTLVNAARVLGTGALQGATNVTCVDGAATFANLWHNRAETITILFSSGSLTNVTSGNVAVGPATLTVRAENQTRGYGLSNAPFTVTYTGFLPGEGLTNSGLTGSPAVTTTAALTSSPALYPINVSTGTLAAANYTFAFVNGTLTVTKAPLTITANNTVRPVGQPNPPLTLSYAGFLLGQDPSVLSGNASVTTTANAASAVGAYPITVTAGSLTSANYAFTFVNGTLNVVATNVFLVDNFTRGSDPGLLFPWLVQAGNWVVTGGQLRCGTNVPGSYSYLYLTNLWTDYSAQTQLRLTTNGFGGGVAVRLNPATGARYAAWIYPEGSPGGSRMLRLLRFQDWTTFTVLQEAVLPAVGTNWHTLKLYAQGNRLAAHFDGSLAATATDTNAQPFLTGSVDLEMWTDAAPYTLLADDVTVMLPGGVVASNDTYSVRQSGWLNVPAPGVLGNDVTEMGGLQALLVAGPAHGSLSLNTNGSFSYLPVSGYLGADSFTYRATDGSTTSGVATVSITVTVDKLPVANNNSYSLMANTLLSVPAPGILANDTDADGDNLTAVPGAAPTHGLLSLNADGGFTYTPAANYVGSDSFTYRAFDGLSNSSLATVNLTITNFTPWFTDAFSRTTLSPWVAFDGNWAVADGVLTGGTNTGSAYGHVYLTNQWNDCAIQARVRLSTNGFGGGIFGRLNPLTGARYAAWIYPETSPAGPKLIKLLKFQDWTQFTVLQQVSLPAVGTNWHTLKLAMRGSRVAALYDGVLRLSVNDPAAQPLPAGGAGVDLWTLDTPWTLSADDVTVTPIRNVVATNDSYAVSLSGTLTVAAPGLLANDFSELDNLSPVLVSAPAHGTLLLNPSGAFAYAPAVGYAGADSFTYRATDGVTTSDVATVNLAVNPPGTLLADDFTRTNPPGALSPWVVRSGLWTATNGVLQGGTNAAYTYGTAYLTNSWTDYEAQARLQFLPGSFGGGLAARVNLATGARYALWLYPEGSVGGSNSWKLLKFQTWTAFTVLQQGNLPSPGADWHTVKISAQGPNLAVSCDDALLASVLDPQPYLSGAVCLEFYTDTVGYQMAADDVQVTSLAPDLSVITTAVTPVSSNQTLTVSFLGSAGNLYEVQATTNVGAPASWVVISTNIAGADGRWAITDSLTNTIQRYYRAVRP